MSKPITIPAPEASTESTNLVFETTEGSILQCDLRGSFTVNFFEESIDLKLCGLLAFRKKLNKVDLSEMFSAESPEVELIYLPHCDRLFAFSVMEILALKGLMEGAITILHLNSLIHRQTVRRPAFLSDCR